MAAMLWFISLVADAGEGPAGLPVSADNQS
jgi:hypothetical protein